MHELSHYEINEKKIINCSFYRAVFIINHVKRYESKGLDNTLITERLSARLFAVSLGQFKDGDIKLYISL